MIDELAGQPRQNLTLDAEVRLPFAAPLAPAVHHVLAGLIAVRRGERTDSWVVAGALARPETDRARVLAKVRQVVQAERERAALAVRVGVHQIAVDVAVAV